MFVSVSGIGHCGTRWLAQLLNRNKQGVQFYHEKKVAVCGTGYWAAMAADYEYHQPYFELMQHKLESHRIVGDSNSWHLMQAGDIAERLPLSRVIVLVRNGILQLRSIHLRRVRVEMKWTEVFLRDYWELAGKPFGDFDAMDIWERICVWWAILPRIVEIAQERWPDIQIEMYRMEDLTHDADILDDLLRSFDIQMTYDDIRAWQEMDIHRHVHKQTRIPSRIYYEIFEPSHRAAFERICGEMMWKLGYDIPTRDQYEMAL